MKIPRIGVVSMGCPKALVDSERIMTQLRAEGYEIVGSYSEADLVIVNTCGFLNEAVAESVEAINEAMQENGKVIVTGCLGAKKHLDGTAYLDDAPGNSTRFTAWSINICLNRTVLIGIWCPKQVSNSRLHTTRTSKSAKDATINALSASFLN